MKRLSEYKFGLACLILLLSGNIVFCQNDQRGDLNLTLNYFSENNKIPYLVARAKTKVNRKFRPVGGIVLQIYLGPDSAQNLIRAVATDDQGEGSTVIPVSLGSHWGSGPKHSFTAVFAGNGKFNPVKADVAVTRAKIELDTTSDKKIIVTLYEKEDTGWAPVKGVDVGITIKRMNAYLNVNETATFTTDSSGRASADFKRDSIPGDANGNIILAAIVDDNDQFGTLKVEKTVSWGARFVPLDNFDKRSLFATRNKAPIWLLFLAYGIVISVWTVLILLVRNILKIRKLGLSA